MPATYCHLCGKDMQGRGKRLQHTKWPRDLSLQVCKDCYQNKPRCRICELPMASETPLGVCSTCRQTLLICRSCGQLVTGDYVEINGAGPYCQTCYRDRLPCDVCTAPLTDESWQLSDGRLTCAHCHATAVYDSQEASILYGEMKTVALQTLGLQLNIPTGLALVDRKQLAEIIRRQTQAQNNRAGSEELDPNKTLGVYTRRGMRRGIYVQTGLPRTLLLQIAAHEFAHAWQGENCPLLRDPVMHEGFAEWVAYKILGQFGCPQQQNHMRSRTDIYGTGLNWALDLESKEGAPGVINACLAA